MSVYYDCGYVRTPKQIKQLLLQYEIALKKLELVGRSHLAKSFDEIAYRNLSMERRTFSTPEGDVERWCKVLPFKASKDQVMRYLKYKQSTAKTKKEANLYTIPKQRGTDKESTGKKELALIFERTGDLVIRHILDHRSISSMINNDLKNWTPHSDGKVHTTYKYIAPTGQFNAVHPNVLNAAKHTDAGQLFRRIIVAPKGYSFVEADYSRFHVITMGREAEDPTYMKFGRLDCHSIFTSWVMPEVQPISLDWSDSDIKIAVKEYRKKVKDFEHIRNAQCKHTVLANNNGAGARKLWFMTRPGIPSEERAQELQDELAHRFKVTEAFKYKVTRLAHEQHMLLSEWGYLRDFWDVYIWSWNKFKHAWEEKRGSQWNEALSYLTQTSAFGMMRERIWWNEELGYNDLYNFINTIHDSFIFMPEDSQIDNCIADIHKVLTAPCETLANKACPNGLVVDCDISIGKNMSYADRPDVPGWNNPDGMREVKLKLAV